MEKSLEVTDNSSKLEDENASSYSAYFQLDNLQPSKKGTRESVSLHVKVNIASDPSLCHMPDSTSPTSSVHLVGLIADFPAVFSIFMDLSVSRRAVSQCPPESIFFSLFVFQLNGGYEFTTTLQIKIYKANSTQHCDWGTTIQSIEYECHTDEQNNSIKIVKDTFR